MSVPRAPITTIRIRQREEARKDLSSRNPRAPSQRTAAATRIAIRPPQAVRALETPSREMSGRRANRESMCLAVGTDRQRQTHDEEANLPPSFPELRWLVPRQAHVKTPGAQCRAGRHATTPACDMLGRDPQARHGRWPVPMPSASNANAPSAEVRTTGNREEDGSTPRNYPPYEVVTNPARRWRSSSASSRARPRTRWRTPRQAGQRWDHTCSKNGRKPTQ